VSREPTIYTVKCFCAGGPVIVGTVEAEGPIQARHAAVLGGLVRDFQAFVVYPKTSALDTLVCGIGEEAVHDAACASR
jgi:hypothetical protein